VAKAAPKPKWRKWAPKTVGGYAGIIMGLALSGIVVNAVLLQQERRPSPLFAPEATSTPAGRLQAPAAPAPSPTAAMAAPKAEATPSPTPRPTDRGAAPQPTPTRKSDPIGDLVRSSSAGENTKTVFSAQRALVKLGYDLQPDGSMGATTIEALHAFETTHGLPVTSELSPRLLAKLGVVGR
jgi:hypothetical protein